jgi:hypothetical protein
VDIKRPGAPDAPATRPTSEVGATSAARLAATARAALPRDGFERGVAVTSPQATETLPTVAPAAVALTDTEARGAASFAAQLDTLGSVAQNEEDLLAKFLKLQVKDDKEQRVWENTLQASKHVLAQMGIMIARSMQSREAVTYAMRAYIDTLFHQVDRDLGATAANTRQVQQRSLEATRDKHGEKDNRSVGDPKKKGQQKKAGLLGMPTEEDTASVSAAVAADGGVGWSMLSIDQIRGDVVRSITDLVERRAVLVGQHRS